MTTSSTTIRGIHHVSAITGDAQRNVDFYTSILGLRLVKQTVNVSDPNQLHLFYGDGSGDPGSLISFYVWPGGQPGQHGVGEIAVTAFAISPNSVGFWLERLIAAGIPFDGPTQRKFGDGPTESALTIRDPDGLILELVAHPDASIRPGSAAWEGNGDIPSEHAIRGLHNVALWVKRPEAAQALLGGVLGFRPLGNDGSTQRLVVGDGTPGQIVDVRAIGGFVEAVQGTGSVDHVAWTADAVDLESFTREIEARTFEISPILDRRYFESLYVRDETGVLHELATPGPGFTIDEPVATLGEKLTLPGGFEIMRSALETNLPSFHLPTRRDPESWFSSVPAEAETSELQGYVYRFTPGSNTSDTSILQLHGTGGDERSLDAITRAIAPDAAIISPRGNVREGTSNRFFRRLAEGDLDLEDLDRRTHLITEFARSAVLRHDLNKSRLIALGFSNGANIATSMLLKGETPLGGAILLSPMLPFEPEPLPDLDDLPVFIGAGQTDPLVPAEQVKRLIEILESAGARVTVHWDEGGHAITASEIHAAHEWLESFS